MPIMYISSYEEYPVYNVSEKTDYPLLADWVLEFTQEEVDRIKRCYDEYEEVHELIRKKIQEEIKIAGRKKR